jgi:uncharacterized protein YbcI
METDVLKDDATAISNAIAHLHKESYGRGAGRVRTAITRDFVSCVLEDVYTPVERLLIDAGRFDLVREARNIFQDKMQTPFSTIVEQATGRKVIGFLSQVTQNPDISLEFFMLEPRLAD